jgi:tetratricopeptide (TPR) repeat protein
MLGLCRTKNGKAEDGSRLLQKAMALAPHDALILEMVANAYDTNLDDRSAQTYYEKIVEFFPQNPQSWIVKGEFLERQGKLRAAQECYTRALSLNQRFESAYTHRAKLFFRQAQVADAVNDCSSCLKLRSESDDSAKCLQLRASCYEKLGQPAKAIADLKLFLDQTKAASHPLFRSQDKAYLELATAYMQMGKYSEAKHYLSILRSLNPKSTQAVEQEAKLCELQGDYAGAVAIYNQLLKSDDTVPAWRVARDELQRKISKGERSAAVR